MVTDHRLRPNLAPAIPVEYGRKSLLQVCMGLHIGLRKSCEFHYKYFKLISLRLFNFGTWNALFRFSYLVNRVVSSSQEGCYEANGFAGCLGSDLTGIGFC